MAIALGAENDSITAGTTGTATVTASAGDLLVLCWVIRNGATFVSIVDTQLQTWVEVTTPVFASGARAGIHFFPNAAAGSTTVTLTAGSSDTIILNLSRWTGAATSSALDTFGTASQAAQSAPRMCVGDITTNSNCGLVLGVSGQASTVTDETAGTGFTALALTAGNNRQWWQYNVATAGSLTTGCDYATASVTHVGMVASFLNAAGGGRTTRNTRAFPLGMEVGMGLGFGDI